MKPDELNFIPEEEKAEADEALRKQKKSQAGEMKLVIPKVEEKGGEKVKKESWLQRRKKRKAAKEAEKRRKRGETAIKEAVKTHKTEHKEVKKVKPGLFEGVKPKEKKEEKPPLFKKAEVSKKELAKKRPAPAEKKAEPKLAKPPKPPKAPKTSWWQERKAKKKEEPAPAPKPAKLPKPPKPKKEKPAPPAKPEPKPIVLDTKKGEAKSSKMHQPEGNVEGFGPSVNLVPEGVRVATHGQPWVLSIIVLLLITAIWLVTAGIALTHVKNIEAKVLEKQTELAKLDILIKDAESIKGASQLLQKQFKAIGELLGTHVVWEDFFKQLEEKTIPDVYYVNLNATESGEIILGSIAKTYESAARQIRSFERSPGLASSVSVTEARVELQPASKLPVPIVRFDIVLQLADGVLLNSIQESE